MTKHLTVLRSEHNQTGKIFLPEYILIHMNWNKNTPLTIKPMTNGFGVVIHKNMMKFNHNFLKYRRYYNSPYLHTPVELPLIITSPVTCSYLIGSGSHPPKLNVIFPTYLRKVL